MAEIGTSIPVTIPSPSVTAGPLWAQEISNFLTEVNDGFAAGVRSSVGLNVDSDLQLGGNGLLDALSITFSGSFPGLSANTVYVASKELWFVNGDGVPLQMTIGGALNAASLGGINGDYGGGNTADVSFLEATNAFVFTQDVGVAAKMDFGSFKVRQEIAGANAVEIKSPNSLAGAYSLTLPAALPASTSIVTLTSAGVLSSTRDPTLDTLTITGALSTVIGSIDALAVGEIDVTTSGGGTGNVEVQGDLTLTGSNKTVHAPRLQTDEGDVRHGGRAMLFSSASGQIDDATAALLSVTIPAIVRGSGSSGTAAQVYFDLVMPSGCTLTTVSVRVLDTSGTHPYMKLWQVSTGAGTISQVGSTQTASTLTLENLQLTGLTSTVSASFRYVVEIGLCDNAQAVYNGFYTYTAP